MLYVSGAQELRRQQFGWVRRQGQYLHVLLQGYSDPKVQAAVARACQRVNQAQVKLAGGHWLCMEVAAKILDWQSSVFMQSPWLGGLTKRCFGDTLIHNPQS